MRERRERACLAAELAQRGRLDRLVGPQHLGDQDGEVVLVPDEEDLVAGAAAEAVEHGAAGSDRLAGLESPRGPLAGGPGPGGARGDRGPRRLPPPPAPGAPSSPAVPGLPGRVGAAWRAAP